MIIGPHTASVLENLKKPSSREVMKDEVREEWKKKGRKEEEKEKEAQWRGRVF